MLSRPGSERISWAEDIFSTATPNSEPQRNQSPMRLGDQHGCNLHRAGCRGCARVRTAGLCNDFAGRRAQTVTRQFRWTDRRSSWAWQPTSDICAINFGKQQLPPRAGGQHAEGPACGWAGSASSSYVRQRFMSWPLVYPGAPRSAEISARTNLFGAALISSQPDARCDPAG